MKKVLVLLMIVFFVAGCGSISNQIVEDVVKNSIYIWQDQTYIPEGYSFTTPNEMLVIGNSISYHPEWSLTRGETTGMAASSPDKDYSHILASLIGVTTENLKVENHWDIERSFWYYDFNTLPSCEFVVIELGDNIGAHIGVYSVYLNKLIDRYQAEGSQVILLSTILPSQQQDKNNQIRASAVEKNIPYLDVRGICLDDSCIPGTGIENQHPNDKGMRLIAERVYSLITE